VSAAGLAHAWIVARTFDAQRASGDEAVLVDLAARASEGKIAGRDLASDAGPFAQALAWMASPAARSPSRAAAWIGGAFSLAILLACLALVRTLDVRPSWRVAAFVVVATASLWLGARALPILLALLAVERAARPTPAQPSAAALVFSALLLSPPTGLGAHVAIGAAALGEAISLRASRDPVRPAFARLGRLAAILAGLHVVFALAIAPAIGASWFDWLAGAVRAPSAWPAPAWNAARSGAGVVLALGACAVAAFVALVRDRQSASILAGAICLGLVAVGAVDPAEVASGALPIVVALVWTGSHALARGRFAVAGGLGVAVLVFAFGWTGRHPDPLRAWSPAEILHATIGGGEAGATAVPPALSRAVAIARDERLACVGASPHGATLTWHAGFPSEIGNSDPVQDARCPLHVRALRAADAGSAPGPAGDLALLAEHYALRELDGTAVILARRRDPDPAASRFAGPRAPLPAAPARGRVVVPLDPAVRRDHLLLVEYALDAPPGGTPEAAISVRGPGGWSAPEGIPMARGRHAVLVALDVAAAERLWLLGGLGGEAPTADRIAFRFRGGFRARFAVESMRELRPGGAGAPAAPVCVSDLDLVGAFQSGRVVSSQGGPHLERRSIFLHPQPPDAPPSEVVFRLTPCPNTCLASGLYLGAPQGDGDGVDFEVDVVDRGNVRPLAREHLAPGSPERRLQTALGPFAGHDVFVRLGTRPGPTTNFDWASFVEPKISPCR
jgi:hypothetical protein